MLSLLFIFGNISSSSRNSIVRGSSSSNAPDTIYNSKKVLSIITNFLSVCYLRIVAIAIFYYAVTLIK